MTQLSMPLSPLERTQKDFLGETFDRKRDGARLNAQERRVFECMRDGEWRGLRDIAALTGDPEASVSARLRGLRKDGHKVEREYAGCGLWQYKLTPRAQDRAR